MYRTVTNAVDIHNIIIFIILSTTQGRVYPRQTGSAGGAVGIAMVRLSKREGSSADDKRHRDDAVNHHDVREKRGVRVSFGRRIGRYNNNSTSLAPDSFHSCGRHGEAVTS